MNLPARPVLPLLLLSIAVLLSPVHAAQVDGLVWDSLLVELMAAPVEEQERLVEEMLEFEPDLAELAASIRSAAFPEASAAGTPELRTTVCIDGVKRPWV
ncbi:hypothetical protein K8S17_06020, partial [bacterium]|nr:hypothetical protein [bacterium]